MITYYTLYTLKSLGKRPGLFPCLKELDENEDDIRFQT